MSGLRDHALSGLAGILVGFVAAYFLFESVAERQPQRRAFHGGDAAAVAGPGADGGAAPGAGGGGPAAAAPQAGGGASGGAPRAPFMEQVAAIEAEIAAAPADPAPRRRLAELFFGVGLFPQAERAFESYLELQPDDPRALTDFGVTLYQQSRFDEALAQFRRAREIAPDSLEPRFNEALALAFGLRRFDEAEAAVEELRRLEPGHPDIERLAAGIAQAKGAA
jgi:tetratricopeptide (TPR) repeat protein